MNVCVGVFSVFSFAFFLGSLHCLVAAKSIFACVLVGRRRRTDTTDTLPAVDSIHRPRCRDEVWVVCRKRVKMRIFPWGALKSVCVCVCAYMENGVY